MIYINVMLSKTSFFVFMLGAEFDSLFMLFIALMPFSVRYIHEICKIRAWVFF